MGQRSTTRLNDAKQYLKGDFKLHLKLSSTVPDHCLVHALSDVTTSSGGVLFTKLCDHQHNEYCDRCEQMKRLLVTIETTIRENIRFTDEDEEIDAMYEVPKAISAIHDYQRHVVRTIYQEMVLRSYRDTLDSTKTLCTGDWAMKSIIARQRETQAMWFGKKGISYSICVCIYLPQPQSDFLTRSYVHVFTKAFQDAAEIAAIHPHVLRKIKEEIPADQEVIFRSDNAGCYHSASLMASMAEVKKQVSGIHVSTRTFSEAQSGKGPADRLAAAIKKNVNAYVNEGNQVTNADEFITAAASHRGLKAVSLYTGTIDTPDDGGDSDEGAPGSSRRGVKRKKGLLLHLDQHRLMASHNFITSLLRMGK